VTLSQIIAFLSFQIRVAAGLYFRLLARDPDALRARTLKVSSRPNVAIVVRIGSK